MEVNEAVAGMRPQPVKVRKGSGDYAVVVAASTTVSMGMVATGAYEITTALQQVGQAW